MKNYTTKMQQNSKRSNRSFKRNQEVYVYNHTGKSKWLAGFIESKIADRTYEIDIGCRKIKRHIDDIILRKTARDLNNNCDEESDDNWMYACSSNLAYDTGRTRSIRRSPYPNRVRRPVDRYGMVNYT